MRRTNIPGWDIVCEPAVLENLKGLEEFWQILALARSVNALSFTHSALVPVTADDSWNAQRTRTNSFLFACAILYEALLLVEKMNRNFQHDKNFIGLKAMLKDKTARDIRKLHLGRARNNVVFHYLPESFGKSVNVPGSSECSFVAGNGNTRVKSWYTFSDILAMEFLLGYPANGSEEFYVHLGKVMSSTRHLGDAFVDAADHLISQCLLKWGFKLRHASTSGTIKERKKSTRRS